MHPLSLFAAGLIALALAGCSSEPLRRVDALAASQGAAKKLAKAMKGGTLRPLPGEHPIDAALTAGALDPAEAEQLRMAELARRKVIDVDDFAKEELTLDEGRIR